MEKLVKIGESLLNKMVSRVNPMTGLSEPIDNGGTNADALKRYQSLDNNLCPSIQFLARISSAISPNLVGKNCLIIYSLMFIDLINYYQYDFFLVMNVIQGCKIAVQRKEIATIEITTKEQGVELEQFYLLPTNLVTYHDAFHLSGKDPFGSVIFSKTSFSNTMLQ